MKSKLDNSFINLLPYPVLIISALLGARYFNGVLLFHTLAELFSIFVGLLMLVVVLNTQHFIRNDFLIYLGIGYFAVSLIDTMHTFTVKGIPFFNITDGEITLHFWIYGRILESTLLLSSTFFLFNKLKINLMIISTAIIVLLVCWASFYLEEPKMFINGSLSDFKRNAEFIVISILVTSAIMFIRNRALLDKNVLFYLLASIGLTVVAEFCFTLYTNFQGIAFVVGHIFKFLSFWMIYQAIIQTTLSDPIKMLTVQSNSYDAIPTPAIRTDELGIISQVNKSALTAIKRSLTEVIHQSIHQYFHPTDIEESCCKLCHAIKSGQTIENKTIYFPQSQEWFLLSIAPIDSNNIKGGILQSLTNITTQKAQEQELIAYKDLLEERVQQRTKELEQSLKQLDKTHTQLFESKKMASLGGLVAGVAHEINTPIGICVTAASHLDDSSKSTKALINEGKLTKSKLDKYIGEAEQSCKLINSNLQKSAELISSFKQVAVDQSSERFRIFLVKEYVHEVLVSLTPKIKEANINILFDIENDFKIHSSPSAISQILTNFIMNSIIHGFKGSENGKISIRVLEVDGLTKITYQDNGCGIPDAHLKKIFEPFFTTNRGQGGSGLGLHIVYNLVHQSLKGSLTCTSNDNQGTCFEVTFPKELNEESRSKYMEL
jgi:signal transduction histidine kinase